MRFAAPSDFCTVAWAAEKIGVSQRQVRYLIRDGKLFGAGPRTGKTETGRRHTMLYVDQVTEYAAAYRLVKSPPQTSV